MFDPSNVVYAYEILYLVGAGVSLANTFGAFDDSGAGNVVGAAGVAGAGLSASTTTDVANVAAASAAQGSRAIRQERAEDRAKSLAVDARLDAGERERLGRLRAGKAARSGRGSTVLSTATGLTGDTTGAATLLGG